MSLTTEVTFRRTDVSFNETNCTPTFTEYTTKAPVDSTGWTLTHIQAGIYELIIPAGTVKTIYSIVDNATGLITVDGVIEPPAITPQQVWEYADRSLTTIDEGAGAVLFSWTEYQAGHNNDPNYGVPDVTVMAYSNNLATGSPVAKGVTDETGTVIFYLDPGTYYLFRRKAGRTFTNPATVEVNFGGNTDQEPENPNEIAFTWTEYEAGFEGNPAYVIPNVWIRVYTNNRAAGTPEATGTTGNDGSVVFYIPANTYYLFRYKSGRVFNNPFTVVVS